MAATQEFDGNEARSDGFGEGRRRLFLVALRKGESVLAACRLVGISNRTAYNHRQRDPEFARAWELSRSMAWMPAELAAFERAVTGVEESVYVHGKLSHKRRRFSDSLLRKLLEGENPRKYGRAAEFGRQRKWLKKQIAAQVAAAIGPLLGEPASRECREPPSRAPGPSAQGNGPQREK